jgi:hypothetical protein
LRFPWSSASLFIPGLAEVWSTTKKNLVAFHRPCYLWQVQKQSVGEGSGTSVLSGLESESLRKSLEYARPHLFDRQCKLKDLAWPRSRGPKLAPWVFIYS